MTSRHAPSLPLVAASWVAGRVTERFALWWRNRRTRNLQCDTIALMRALDDRTLKDIGIDRSEIESVVYDTSGERHRGMTNGREPIPLPRAPPAGFRSKPHCD